MMLLVLKSRKRSNSDIMQAFSKWFSDSDVLLLPGYQFNLNAANIDQLPEVKQFTHLLYDLVPPFYQSQWISNLRGCRLVEVTYPCQVSYKYQYQPTITFEHSIVRVSKMFRD